ncbi:protoporphyrinogen oxidase HemJ [Neomegalonema perideroedes]|uniref:protoporphyrinogen oxidase HemJ n=1 Tax=Neomegalonema perideroedes TaxID=217219 RepID=UPI00037BCD55|nr:protoporphyrinogen oxidase HemJ [Neomegalonema perideroedes]
MPVFDALAPAYLWLKWLHIAAVISWMAGMFYLPRLYVYHTRATPGSEMDSTFQTMERKLLKIIMNPAMIVTWAAGLLLSFTPQAGAGGWLHAKIALVLVLSGVHGMLSRYRKDFAAGANKRPEKFYRMINEAPTILMLLIVALVVFKPF